MNNFISEKILNWKKHYMKFFNHNRPKLSIQHCREMHCFYYINGRKND